MSMTRWEPFRDLITLRDAMDRIFDENYVRPGARWTTSQGEQYCSLPIDIYTTGEEIVIQASVPGLDPEKVDITLEGDTLTIKGEVAGPLENVNYVIQEMPCGKFQRTLRLNVPIEAEKAEASFDKGVLTLVVPKQEEIRPKTIKVSTKE